MYRRAGMTYCWWALKKHVDNRELIIITVCIEVQYLSLGRSTGYDWVSLAIHFLKQLIFQTLEIVFSM